MATILWWLLWQLVCGWSPSPFSIAKSIHRLNKTEEPWCNPTLMIPTEAASYLWETQKEGIMARALHCSLLLAPDIQVKIIFCKHCEYDFWTLLLRQHDFFVVQFHISSVMTGNTNLMDHLNIYFFPQDSVPASSWLWVFVVWKSMTIVIHMDWNFHIIPMWHRTVTTSPP